ncbi:MAG: hypothetical protein ABSE48_05345 [Verrucomicrobiota bacterium]|jgi:hypothetical protein
MDKEAIGQGTCNRFGLNRGFISAEFLSGAGASFNEEGFIHNGLDRPVQGVVM